jgi:hypothetical protein
MQRSLIPNSTPTQLSQLKPNQPQAISLPTVVAAAYPARPPLQLFLGDDDLALGS